MKRVLIVAALCSLLAVPLYAADIYWEPGTPADPTITDKDFKFEYGGSRPSKSLEQMNIYDSGERERPDVEAPQQAPGTTARPARTRDVIDLPQTAPPATSRPIEPARRVRQTIQPARRTVPATQVAPVSEPQAPAVKPVVPDETKRPVPVPAIAEEPAKTEPKRLPWGQDEPKTDTGAASKFKWGERPK